jgi:hypothetical protein
LACPCGAGLTRSTIDLFWRVLPILTDLMQHRGGSGAFEIIFVDDGSRDGISPSCASPRQCRHQGHRPVAQFRQDAALPPASIFRAVRP